MLVEKTHWKSNPNKKYLGHWDLPNGEDVILTIESAKIETILNPKEKTSEKKTVIRFKENHKWIKPWICNITNLAVIAETTEQKYLEDWTGFRVKLSVKSVRTKTGMEDAIRVKNVPQSELQDKVISAAEIKALNKKLTEAKKDKETVCRALGVSSIDQIPSHKYKSVINRLTEIINGNN